MESIQSSNKVADMFGAGTHGFGPGAPGAGQVATYLTPDWCNGVQQEIINVIQAAGLTPDGGNLAQLLTALQALFGAGIRYYATGIALPTSDKGPIWHADFNSIMTWQVFNANGAAYEGYASQFVGTLFMDTQATPRAGYVASGASGLARVGQYAALRAWARHNGVLVDAGVWSAGGIAFADNPDGTTFRVFDVRGEYPRFWDSGRGVDAGRGAGTWADGTRDEHIHLTGRMVDDVDGGPSDDVALIVRGAADGKNYTGRQVSGDQQHPVEHALPGSTAYGAWLGTGDPIYSGLPPSPRNVALPAYVKF